LHSGEKVQVIDLSLLQGPLQALADDPGEGGTPGHVAIVPVDADGNVDQALLEEWADARNADLPHPLTDLVLAAVVREEVRK
jgi:hypothetical protein